MSQKIILVFASLLIAIVGLSCNDYNDDEMFGLYVPPSHRPTNPPPGPSLTASQTVDSVLYTFAIPKTNYGINDTVSATLTFYNESTSAKTLYFVCSPIYSVLWSLNNSSGQTLIYGPGAICQVIVPYVLNPQESSHHVVINEIVKNIQGQLLNQSGSYVLHGQMNNMSPPWSFDFDITIVSASTPLELISNTSFESNGMFTLQGWNIFMGDTTAINSMRDAPPGGGMWSLSIIDNGNIPTYSIESTVAALPGNHVYKFSLWGKSSYNTELFGGEGWLLLKRNNTFYNKINLDVADAFTVWTYYSGQDTINSILGDSLIVHLYGDLGYLTPPLHRMMYDLVKLEVLQ